MLDEELCFRAIESKDARFDGCFFTAVVTTGIYCRPSCPALPHRANVRFYPSAAAAQEAGFRACKRCRPDAAPGSPEWNVRADVVGRAMRLIVDGVVDREGVAGLARRLGYTERHLHRQLLAEVGAGPLAIARAQRAQTARLLLEATGLRIADVAFAAGFSSIRQFNDTMQAIYAMTPSGLRNGSRRDGKRANGTMSVRLPLRAPFDGRRLFRFLSARAVPGVEGGSDSEFRRTLRLPRGFGIVELQIEDLAPAHVRCVLTLEDIRDLSSAIQRCRRLLDLDADPLAIQAVLGDDSLLKPLVIRSPGLRIPGHVDGAELATRAILGQQISVAAARTTAGKLVDRFGARLPRPYGELTHLYPSPESLSDLEPRDLPLPRSRAAALIALSCAVAEGRVILDPGVDRDEATSRLLELPGIGAWTAGYVRMRALGDPDVFLPTDLGARRSFLGLGAEARARPVDDIAQRWRPWRSYALQYLWTHDSESRVSKP